MTWLPPYLGGILGTRLKISEPWDCVTKKAKIDKTIR
jgi:hypothetical protein